MILCLLIQISGTATITSTVDNHYTQKKLAIEFARLRDILRITPDIAVVRKQFDEDSAFKSNLNEGYHSPLYIHDLVNDRVSFLLYFESYVYFYSNTYQEFSWTLTRVNKIYTFNKYISPVFQDFNDKFVDAEKWVDDAEMTETVRYNHRIERCLGTAKSGHKIYRKTSGGKHHHLIIADDVIIGEGFYWIGNVYIGSKTVVRRNVSCGSNVIVGDNTYLGLGSSIGETSLVGSFTYIDDFAHIKAYSFLGHYVTLRNSHRITFSKIENSLIRCIYELLNVVRPEYKKIKLVEGFVAENNQLLQFEPENEYDTENLIPKKQE